MSQQLPEPPKKKTKQQTLRRDVQPASAHSFQAGLHPILQLQRTLGNRRVAQLMQTGRLTREGRILGLQPKLTVGAADDQYEQEADRVARQVLSIPDSVVLASSLQASRLKGDASFAQALQSKPLTPAASITPFLQRLIGAEEAIERDQGREEGKDELLRAKFFNKPAALPLQRQTATEDEKTDSIQVESVESLSDSFEVGDVVESRLNQSKGGGSQLPNHVRAYTEPRFGADFSHVRVHNDSDAAEMNHAVGAKAFTQGSDIYLGEGYYPANSQLIAHESTHVQRDIDAQMMQRMSQAEPDDRQGTLTTAASPRSGCDFSWVPVHNRKAEESAQVLNGFASRVRRDRVFGAEQYSPSTNREQQLSAHGLTEKQVNRRFSWNPSFFVQGRLPPARDLVHAPLLDQYSRDTGLPVDAITAHDPGYEAWLLGRPLNPPSVNVILDMPVPATPNPDYSRDESQLGAWEKANFLFSARLSFSCDRAINNGRESSFVTDVGIQFTQPTFQYFIARHIYENMNNPGMPPDVRITWRRIHARVYQHAVEHFRRYRQVVDTARQTIMQRLAVLPTRNSPIGIPQSELEAYVGNLLSYLIASLRFQLWQTTCDWERTDYPNLLRGIPNVSGRFVPACDPQPSVPPEPHLPIIVTPGAPRPRR